MSDPLPRSMGNPAGRKFSEPLAPAREHSGALSKGSATDCLVLGFLTLKLLKRQVQARSVSGQLAIQGALAE